MRHPIVRPTPHLAVILPVALLIALVWALGVAAQPSDPPPDGEWTTGGPYGGEVIDLVVNPVTPTTAYALLHNAGLYITHDAGATWRPALIDPWPQGVAIDAIDPNLVYFAGQMSLFRSPDAGDTWERIDALPQAGPKLYPVTHPISTGVLYLGVGVPVNRPPIDGEVTGVFRWNDATRSWSPTSGLTDTLVTSLAFHPTDPATMAASTRNGNVFVSEDAGETWEWRARVNDYVYRLVYNPLAVGEVWALTKDPTGWTEPPTLYRSTDAALTAWEPFSFPSSDAPVLVRSAAFDLAATPPTAYLALHGEPALTSVDGGLTWTTMAGSPPAPTCFAFTDDDLRYAGTIARGAYVSTDAASWEHSSQGLAGVLPEAMVAIPGEPEIAYAYAQTAGMLRTTDGGQRWEEVPGVRRDGLPWRNSVLAAEGGAEASVYLGSGCNGAPCLIVGDVDGSAWVTRTLPMPASLDAGHTADVFAVYADPSRPGRVLAGVTFFPPSVDITMPVRPLGAVYLSDDRGATWEAAYDVTTTLPISGVVEFAASPAAPDVIYAATDGTGLLRTTDGGAHWEPIDTWTGPASVRSVAVDRVSADTVYAAAIVPDATPGASATPGVYVSHDAGATWEHMPGTGGDVWALHMAASQPQALYLGTWGGGVRRLAADGTWSPLSAVPERSNVFALTSARDAEHAIIYVGLSGEGGAAEGLRAETGTILRADEARSGGIYQLVARDRPPLFLPLSARNLAP